MLPSLFSMLACKQLQISTKQKVQLSVTLSSVLLVLKEQFTLK